MPVQSTVNLFIPSSIKLNFSWSNVRFYYVIFHRNIKMLWFLFYLYPKEKLHKIVKNWYNILSRVLEIRYNSYNEYAEFQLND